MNKVEKALKSYKEKFDMGPMVSHVEFMDGVVYAASLPAQTCRALGPESEEDISMYANCEEKEGEQ